jgi:hypothetical protein
MSETMTLQQVVAAGAADIVEETAARRWEQQHANFVAAFDVQKLYQKLVNYMRLNGIRPQTIDEFHVDSLMAEYDHIFAELYDRGALAAIRKITPLPALAERELAMMRGERVAPILSPEAAAKKEREEKIKQCAQDYKTMEGSSFRLKYSPPEMRGVFEEAISRGLIR